MLIQRTSALLLSGLLGGLLLCAASNAGAADAAPPDESPVLESAEQRAADEQAEHAETEDAVAEHANLEHANATPELRAAQEFKSDLAIYTFIVFLLLLLVLLKFAWNPISKALDERERSIADHIAAAEAKHEEAKQLLAGYEQKLAGAADEVRQLLEEARRDAEHAKAEIIAEAKTAAQAEHERAMRDVRGATDAAMKQLAEQSANLAVDLAGRIVRGRINPEEENRLVREALAKMPGGMPSAN